MVAKEQFIRVELDRAPGGQLLIPATQAAKMLGVSRRTLYNRIKAGLIRPRRISSSIYVPRTELDRLILGTQPASANSTGPENVGKGRQDSENGGEMAIGNDYRSQCRFIESQPDFPAILAEVIALGLHAGPEASHWDRTVARAEWRVRHKGALPPLSSQ